VRVAVFGLGYVGTVTAAVLAANGHEVWGVDIDPAKAALVESGASTVVEPGLDALIRCGVDTGSLRATTDVTEALEDADLSIICVGSPSSQTGSTDLTYVTRAVTEIAESLAAGPARASGRHAIVIRSTVPPGTIDERLTPLLGQLLRDAPIEVGLGMCPEFLREGSAIRDFYEAPFTVIGTRTPWLADDVRSLFDFLDSPVRVVAPREAEGLKYACNAFHATKVSFVNEIGRLFRALDVDTRKVMALFCEDTKLNLSASYLAPGFAFGGSCLPKDLRSLLYQARMQSIDLPLLSGTLATNELSINDVINRVMAADAHAVAIMGLSFKMDSDDLRESPYVELAETLIGKGFDVRIYDPIVDPSRLVGANRQVMVSRLPHVHRVLHPSAEAALERSDIALVSSSHPAVIDALIASPPRAIVDLSGKLGPEVEALPQYEGVAW
jgi:GDP-mannose 6-dehydrogenase